jgi:Cys-tRNA synthase (O-phospho-L-seryl-tRNA:Cys-tRNA synthase)
MKNTKMEEMLETYKDEDYRKLSRGAHKVLLDYKDNMERYGTFCLDGTLWEKEMPAVLAFLDEVDVRDFILIDESTGLMGALYFFLNSGWQIHEAGKISIRSSSGFKGEQMGLLMVRS